MPTTTDNSAASIRNRIEALHVEIHDPADDCETACMTPEMVALLDAEAEARDELTSIKDCED